MITLINYSHRRFGKSQKKNSQTGKEVGGFDNVIEYGIEDIDTEFKDKNAHIFIHNRLAGYGIWKPYVVLKALESRPDGEYVFYCDSGSFWLDSVRFLFNEPHDWLLCFSGYDSPLPIEKRWCKRDAFILMDCDKPEYTDTVQLYDGFFLVKNCEDAKNFFKEWLEYAQDERISTDIENKCGEPNYPEFKDHRHDQAIMSLLVKKYKIPMCNLLPDQFRPIQDSYSYPQLIEHTRDPQ